jgi:hypothetical protein
MLNNEKRTPQPSSKYLCQNLRYIQFFTSGFTKMVYTNNRCAREQGDGENVVFPPAPLLNSNWQDYLEHSPNIPGMWFI